MKPHLVQRIRAPHGKFPQGMETMERYYTAPPSRSLVDEFRETALVLNALIPLAYMGSAEYEFGAVHRCLRDVVASRADIVPFQLDLTGIPYAMWSEQKARGVDFSKRVSLQGWCLKQDVEDLRSFLVDEANGTCKSRLKERSELQEGCFGSMRTERVKGKRPLVIVQESDITGWLDLENLWFVGRDVEQVKGFAYLLGIKI